MCIVFGFACFTKQSYAQEASSGGLYCQIDVGQNFANIWWKNDIEDPLKEHVTDSFVEHEDWIKDTLWDDNILPAMRGMADELSAISTYHAFIIGTFFDAKHQIETQEVLQTIRARAHKDYQPSTGMCEFGSVSKSLAASERKSEYNALVLSQRAQDRNLGTVGTSGATGKTDDLKSRVAQFAEKFCDQADNNNGLKLMCPSPPSGDAKKRINKDIDYTRTVDSKWTLDIDLTDTGAPTEEEEEVFALATNLYGHEVARAGLEALDTQMEGETTDAQRNYLTLRSLLAKRSVAENSYNAIVAMKSNGLPGSKDYLTAVMEELGVSKTATSGGGSQTDMDAILGENPSYYAQMEVLTKKLYQNPEFYTNLYDKPANVGRKEVALQAIGLMQKFDMFKSHLRSEASLAVLLELEVSKLQGTVEKVINDSEGRTNAK
jgi:hypothetical protein